MKLTYLDILALLSFPTLMSFGQLLFRKMALLASGKPLPSMVSILAREPTFYAALVLYGTSTFLWVWLLGRYSLALAYPFAMFAVVAVPVLEKIFFAQRLAPSYWGGLALVILGVLMIVQAKT